jgi:hypothetical protein
LVVPLGHAASHGDRQSGKVLGGRKRVEGGEFSSDHLWAVEKWAEGQLGYFLGI